MPWTTTTHRRRKSYSQHFGRLVIHILILVDVVTNIPLAAALTSPIMASAASSSSFIDKLALILVRNRRQLVVRTKGKEAFFTPGGKRENPDESDIDALCRECKEELTINLKKDTIQPYGVFQAQAFGKPVGTMVRMTCYTADFEGTLKANEEIEELKWIDSTFEHKYLSVTGIQILEDLKSKNLID